jgi:cytochrome c551/c552
MQAAFQRWVLTYKFLSLLLVALSPPAQASLELANRNACMGCHAMASRAIGPSYQDVSRKYSGRPDAVSALAASIKSGSVGKWGRIPMPAQPALSASDANRLAEWILGKTNSASIANAAPAVAALPLADGNLNRNSISTSAINRIAGVQVEDGQLKEVTFLRKSATQWEELHNGKLFKKFEQRHNSGAVLRLVDVTRSAVVEFLREDPKLDELSAYFFAGDLNVSSAKVSGGRLEGRYFQVDSDFNRKDSVWERCADEGGTCVIGVGKGIVRYGVAGNYHHQFATSQLACHNVVFDDPAQGFLKACDVIRLAKPTDAPQPLTPPVTNPKLAAHALVIGNANYLGSARLDNPINDANAIADRLKALGFTVTTINDAGRQRLVQALSTFKRSASGADLSLLFYAGHGVQIFGTNYILPIDVDQSDPAQATIQGISLNSIVENFLPGKARLVFLDACRDNPLMRSGDRSVSRGLAPITAAQGTLIAYATKDGQTASDGPGERHSPFTRALLEHLEDPSDISVVLRRVREKVMRRTNGLQQPWEYGSLTGGELVLSTIRGTR